MFPKVLGWYNSVSEFQFILPQCRKGQDYRNVQKQRSEEAQKETIRLIDIGLTQSIKKYPFTRPELSVY